MLEENLNLDVSAGRLDVMAPQIGVTKRIPTGIELTFKCNNSCVFCFYHDLRGLDEMPFERAKKEVRGLKKLGYKVIRLRGSEPTTYSRLDELLEFIRSENLKIAMTTNCRKFSPKFSKKMKDFGLVEVYTSVHGPTPKIHESITCRKGSFAETVAGIKNLLKLGVPVETNTTMCSLNYKALPKIANFLCDGFDSIFRCRFSYLYLGKNEQLSNLLVDFDTLRPKLEEAIGIVDGSGKKFFIEKAPVCATPKYSKYFKAEEFVFDINYKPKLCKKCIYYNDKYCVGVSEQYLKRFGETGLLPIKPLKN